MELIELNNIDNIFHVSIINNMKDNSKLRTNVVYLDEIEIMMKITRKYSTKKNSDISSTTHKEVLCG